MGKNKKEQKVNILVDKWNKNGTYWRYDRRGVRSGGNRPPRNSRKDHTASDRLDQARLTLGKRVKICKMEASNGC